MSYEMQIRRRLLPMKCMARTNPVVSLFDVVVKVTVEGEFDVDEVCAKLISAPYGPWHPRVSAVHGQVINLHLTTLPPADTAPIPDAGPAPLCLTA